MDELRTKAERSAPSLLDDILHLVVNNSKAVTTVFAALADPTRRRMLELLAQKGETRVTDLARPFAISAPAITKHLRVLETANLITRRKRGREHFINSNRSGLRTVQDWIAQHAAGWRFSLEKLDNLLTKNEGG